MKRKIILLALIPLLAGCGNENPVNPVNPTPTPDPEPEEKYHSDYGPTEEVHYYLTANFERNWTADYSDDFKTITKYYDSGNYKDVFILNDYYQIKQIDYYELNDSKEFYIYYQEFYEYNEYGSLINYYSLEDEEGEYKQSDNSVYEYDENNRLIKETYYQLDYWTKIYYLSYINSYQYNENEVIEDYESYNTDGSVYTTFSTKTVTTTDEKSGTYSITVSQMKNNSGEYLIDSISTYDAKTDLLMTYVYYDDGEYWGTTTYTYNKNGDVISEISVQGDTTFYSLYEYDKYGYIVSHDYKFTYADSGIEWRQFTTYTVDTNGVVYSAYLVQTRGGSYENSYYYSVSALKANYNLPLEEHDMVAVAPGNYATDIF